jgi:hypothetical protein
MQPTLDTPSHAVAIGDDDAMGLVSEISRLAHHQLRFIKSPATSI